MDKKYSKQAWAVDINNWPVDVVELAVYKLNDLKMIHGIMTKLIIDDENKKPYLVL